MRLPWLWDNDAVKQALHRYRNAVMRAEQASKEAQEKRREEERATDELRHALQEIVERIRREPQNDSG